MVSIDSWWDAQVRDRSEALLELVINACADDYESLEIIFSDINRWPEVRDLEQPWLAMTAIPVSRPEVIKALQVLIQEGYVQAYDVDPEENCLRRTSFREGDVDDLWFYVTPKGKRAVQQM